MRPEPLVTFFAIGRPVPQKRAAPGRGGHMIMAPAAHAIRGWRDTLRMLAQQAMLGRRPFDGPIRLEILFKFPRPQRLCKAHNRDDMVLHTADRGDWDNVGKAVCDAMNGVVFFDDCQVSTAFIRKRFAQMHEQSGCAVRVYRDRIPWES